MLKGLFIRQAFQVFDLALALAVATVACLAIGRVLDSPGKLKTGAVDPPKTIAEEGGFAKLGLRPEYDIIVTNALFGAAGKGKSDKPPAPPEIEGPPEGPVAVTDRPLRLYGTQVYGAKDPRSAAIIENGDSRAEDKIGTYSVGEPLTDTPSMILAEVHPRKVLLLNKDKNRLEELRMADDDGVGPATAGMARAGAIRPMAMPSRPTPRGGPRIKRADVSQMLEDDPQNLLTDVSPQLYYDEQGKVAGITSANLSSIPLAQQAGLKDNDVVQSVNGVQIDGEHKIFEIFNRFQNASSFRVRVLRDGQPVTLNFSLE
jgi:type II secretion system protein C